MRRTISILILLSTAVLLQGCGTGSFLGQRYDNFTAYYNTFYNAERVFEEGYEGVGQSNERIDRSEFLPVFVRPESGSRAREFESAIEKSADVLRDHPDSKWVDDALMLIGKSYFYRENYVGAIQKFREVTSLGTGREAEGRFWLARTLIISGAFGEAEAELLAALADEGLDRRWAARYRLALGELNVIEQDWEAAAAELSAGLDDIKDDELAARAWFTLGQVYEKLERFEEAADAYRSVRRNSPPYELSYAAEYSATRVDGFHGDVEEALSSVRKMERDDKNLEYQSELRLLRAQILQRRGRDDEAFAIYSDLLYNPNRDMTLGGLRGRVHYSLGELYRDIDGDYVLAAAHFDTARTSLSGNRSQAAAAEGLSSRARAPEAIEDLDILSESFNAYAEVFNEVARLDSLLHLGSLPQDEFDERILELRRIRAEELERQRQLVEEMQRNQQFNRQSADDPFRNSNTGLPEGKVIPDLDEIRGNDSGAGFLGVEDAIRVQEGRVGFISRWGERPLVRNWRREAAISNADVAEDVVVIDGQERTTEGEETATLPEIDVSAVPRDSSAQVDMRRQRALARYELGNTLFLGMNRPDSAAVWYRMVIDEGDSTDVSQRALYALAEVQYSLGDSTSAKRLYRDILDRYPESDFSDNVRDRLGFKREDAPSDSASVSLSMYGAAFARWDSTDSHLSRRRAFNEMLSIAAQWPKTEAGARSLLSATEIHLELAGADSARIFGTLPITVDDSVLENLWPDKSSELGNRRREDSVRAASGERPETGTETPVDSPADPPVQNQAQVDPLAGIEGAAGDSAAAALDVVPADTAGVRIDTSAVRLDSTGVRVDSLAAGVISGNTDRIEAVSDSIGVPVDITASPDSAAARALPPGTVPEREAPSDDTALPEAASDARQSVSPFGHVALSDSLVLAIVPPGTRDAALAHAPEIQFIEVDGGGAFMTTQMLSPLASAIRVQDLLQAVGRLHPRTPYATRAQRISDLLDELLVVEVPADSVSVDSMSVGETAADSVMAAAADSSGLREAAASAGAAMDSVAMDSAGVDSAAADMDPADPAADRLRTRRDSLAAAELSGKQRYVPRKPEPAPALADSIDAAPDTSAAEPGGRPGVRPPPADSTAVDEQPADSTAVDKQPAIDRRREVFDEIDALPSDEAARQDARPEVPRPPADMSESGDTLTLDIDLSALEEEGIRSSTSLRPLTAEGTTDRSAVGWTVVIQSSRDIPTAQLERRRFKTILGEQGEPLQLLIHTQSEEPEVLVVWGLFDTRAELQIALEIAREKAGESFPEDTPLLVLIP